MENTQANAELERKLKEFEQLDRVISNGLNWLNDVEIKVADIVPINEFIGFLNGFKGNIAQQKATIAALLPKVEAGPVLTEAK